MAEFYTRIINTESGDLYNFTCAYDPDFIEAYAYSKTNISNLYTYHDIQEAHLSTIDNNVYSYMTDVNANTDYANSQLYTITNYNINTDNKLNIVSQDINNLYNDINITKEDINKLNISTYKLNDQLNVLSNYILDVGNDKLKNENEITSICKNIDNINNNLSCINSNNNILNHQLELLSYTIVHIDNKVRVNKNNIDIIYNTLDNLTKNIIISQNNINEHYIILQEKLNKLFIENDSTKQYIENVIDGVNENIDKIMYNINTINNDITNNRTDIENIKNDLSIVSEEFECVTTLITNLYNENIILKNQIIGLEEKIDNIFEILKTK